MSENVKCPMCNWRGKRVFRSCDACYDPCSHSGYGHCPHCGWKVDEPSYFRELKRMEKIANEQPTNSL